uniref:Transmembrane protein 182 n=1 Tax=Amphiprion percula TaxID=161767 RepID=A0A3P8SDF9_AMPPE
MKLSVALFFAGLFGALAAVFILLSFGTDYWLLASESCHPNPEGSIGPGDVTIEDSSSDVTLYHEGFFWRCSFGGNAGDENLLWKLWFYRGFWSIFMLIGVAAVALGGFFIICAAPFASHQLYKTGGGLFLTSLFLLCVVIMYILWVQVLDVVDVYIDHQRSSLCPGFSLSLTYGLSFMFAPVGIFFCLLAGLLFLLIGRTIQIHYH